MASIQSTVVIILLTLVICGSYLAISVIADDTKPAPAKSQKKPLPRLPKSVDLRPAFQRLGLTTRAQGSRGTCSVFAVIGALEYAIAKREKQGVTLSVEFLNWAGHTVVNRKADGGFFSELWKGYETYGVCDEDKMPYLSQFNADLQPSDEAREQAKTRQDLKLALHWIKEWNPNTGLSDSEIEAIKRTLSQKHPVCGGLRWPKKADWRKGVLQLCPPEDVFDGHSVLLVGYRDDVKQPGGGVFLIRNSGAPDRDGCLPYAYLRAYMNDAAWIE